MHSASSPSLVSFSAALSLSGLVICAFEVFFAGRLPFWSARGALIGVATVLLVRLDLSCESSKNCLYGLLDNTAAFPRRTFGFLI